MLRRRIQAAVFGLPILFLLLWLNWYLRSQHINGENLPLLLVVAGIAGASGWEVSHIIQQRYPGTSLANGVYAALIIPFFVHAIGLQSAGSSIGLLIDSLGTTIAIMLLFLGLWGEVERQGTAGLFSSLFILLSGLYLGGTMATVLLIGNSSVHELGVLFVFTGVFALDTAAYFGGRHFGGPPIAPKISPHKTLTGALCGLGGALALAAVYSVVSRQLGLTQYLLLGVSLGVLGQVGDLFESAFKRWGNVKDSGNVIPGHGGFLDRFDSLFLAAPAVYVLYQMFLGVAK